MNKKILIAAFLLFCIFLFVSIIISFPKEKVVLDQANKVFIVKGDVKIKKAIRATAQWQKMETSTVLEKGDVVESAEGSSVDIIIGRDNNKAVKIEEKSRVEFNEINPTDLNFSRGKILVALKKLEHKSSFTVKTPTAICGARGTAWSVEAGENKTKICVFESSIYAREVDVSGRPGMKKHTLSEGTQRTLLKNKPISEVQKIGENDLLDWKYWNKNVTYLREGKILINDFNEKANFNNINGPFGSWVVFYSDANQHCKDDFTPFERIGDIGYGLKLDYDVDSPFSAYNGFFTKLMDIDLSDYKYLVFFVKGDKRSGYTTKLNIELKNRSETGKMAVEGITDEWKKMVLPLDQFKGMTGFKDMKELVIMFIDQNVTRKEGIIYIDNIYFAKAESDQ